jgi:hypothetical protein
MPAVVLLVLLSAGAVVDPAGTETVVGDATPGHETNTLLLLDGRLIPVPRFGDEP